MVVDALSREYEKERSIFSLSLPISNWFNEDHQEWIATGTLVQLIDQLQAIPKYPKSYTW